MTRPRIIGPHPFEKDERGKLKTRIATVFPQEKSSSRCQE